MKKNIEFHVQMLGRAKRKPLIVVNPLTIEERIAERVRAKIENLSDEQILLIGTTGEGIGHSFHPRA